jgi:hypothetical protein
MTDAPGRIVRRNNAPIRPSRPATTVPDLLFACAFTCFTMAVVFFGASFLSEDVVSGSAGKVLARFFAGTLLLAGTFMFALGYGLLRDDRSQADHYTFPIMLGIAVGLFESIFFLKTVEQFLFLPLLFLLLAIRPLRRAISGLLFRGSKRTAR